MKNYCVFLIEKFGLNYQIYNLIKRYIIYKKLEVKCGTLMKWYQRLLSG